MMKDNNIIPINKAIEACELLKDNKCTRIPLEDIDKIIIKFKEETVIC